MDTVIKRTYEGMFLVDSGEAAADWQGTIGVIETVLSRSEAEAVTLKKWDERRLTYDINKKNRGTYILTYFDCDPLKISAIERDVQLSEKIMRVMILRTDRMSAEDIAKPTPAMVLENEAARRSEAAAEKAAEAEATAEAEPVAQEAEASVAEDVVDAPAEELPAEEPSEETEDQQ